MVSNIVDPFGLTLTIVFGREAYRGRIQSVGPEFTWI